MKQIESQLQQVNTAMARDAGEDRDPRNPLWNGGGESDYRAMERWREEEREQGTLLREQMMEQMH